MQNVPDTSTSVYTAPRGFTLLYALLLVAAILGVSSTVASLMLRDLKVSGVEQRSLQAFYAAQSGAECAYSWSLERTPFDGSTDIECDGQTIANVGATFTINGRYCATVTVDAFADPVVITSRGYDTCTAAVRQVERAVTLSHAQIPPPATQIPPPVGGGSCTVGLCTGPDGVTNDLSCGLIGHWPMNAASVDMSAGAAEVRDTSGNGRHGDLQNSAGTFIPGGGMYFDGNDSVDLGDIDLTGDFTLSAWARPDTYVAPGVKGILAKNESYILKAWEPGTNQLTFKIRRDDADPRYYEEADYSNALIGRWYHVVGIYDCSTRLPKLYVDGLYISQGGQAADVRLSNDPTTIGVFRNEYFTGGLANIRIYGRALNDTEISALYSEGR